MHPPLRVEMHVIYLAAPIYKDLLAEYAHSVVPAASEESRILSLFLYFAEQRLFQMHFKACQLCKAAQRLLPSRLCMHPQRCMRSRPVSHG